MSISFMAMNRMLEERAAVDEDIRQQLQRNGKCTLSDGRALSDEELLQKLHSLGLTEVDRNWLDQVTQKVPSAQVLATAITKHSHLEIPAKQEDWVWFALVCLWERWFPDRPNFEMLDDQMQAGYQAQQANQRVEAARLWLQVWRGVEYLMKTFNISSIQEFDACFGGTNSVFNWVQDFSDELYGAALTDPSFLQERLAVCQAVLPLAGKTEQDSHLLSHFKRDLAETHAALGDHKTTDQLYTQWLREDPQWGWGWIGWSDIYHLFAPGDHVDTNRAEQILNDGLAVPGVHDRQYLVERLASLYQETGRSAQADALRERTDASLASSEQQESAPETQPEPVTTSERSLDDLIAELDQPPTGKFPEQALREAQRRREEITPRLIDLIRQATAGVRAGTPPQGDGHFFALFLLTEFQAREALPAILEAVSLPGEGPFDLFGDSITEHLARVLATLAGDPIEVIDDLIANRSLNEYVRWEGAQTYLYLVRDGRLTREQAVQRLRQHLQTAIANQDHEIGGPLVSELLQYASHEALDDIKEAYRQEIADEGLVRLEDVEQILARGEQRFQQALEACRQTRVEDTVAELRNWACFQEPKPPRSTPVPSPALPPPSFPSRVWENAQRPGQTREPATVRRDTPRVGRNDPCPCGSGKKYKKCCGKT
jgi:hypothetical protein